MCASFVTLGYGQKLPSLSQHSDNSICSNIVVAGDLTLNCTALTPAQKRIIDGLPAQTKKILKDGLDAKAAIAKLAGIQAAIEALQREQALDNKLAVRGEGQPHFLTELHVDSASPFDGRFRIVVENLGPGSAKNIRCSLTSAAGSDVRVLPEPIILVPRAKAEFEGPEIKGKKRPINVSVDFTYESEDLGSNKRFYSHFNFLIRDTVVDGPAVIPNGIDEGSGVGYYSENFMKIMSGITQPAGTAFLVFPEVDLDGQPNQASYWARDKMLVFDPVQHKASFSVTFGKTTVISDLSFKPTGGSHIVSIVWDSKRMTTFMMVDGVLAKKHRIPMQ
jgi:hypothetical protein